MLQVTLEKIWHYHYGYEKTTFSEETWVEMLSLTAHAIQLGYYSNPFMDTDLTPYFKEVWNEIVDDFIKSNVNPNFQQNVKEAFMNDAKVTVLKKDIVVYRYHGGTSNGTSYWYTPYQTSNPASDLALPSGNTYQYMDTYIIPKGTTILEGIVAPNFGQPGGGYQFYVSDPSVVIKKER